MAVLVTVISYMALAGLAGPLSPPGAKADTPQIDNASIPDVYGYVYDSKGNKVPNAHVSIYYVNGTFLWLDKNPAFTGHDDAQGYFKFSGVDIGNYTVKAEIADLFGDVHSSAASVRKFDDRPGIAYIILMDYVYTPWISPTPQPTAVPAAAVIKVLSTATPAATPAAKNNSHGPLNPLYALAVSPVVAAGVFLFMRNKKAPAAKYGRPYVDAGRSQTLLSDRGVIAGSNVSRGFSEYFLMNDDYRAELEELVRCKIKYHYNDIAVIHRVEKIARRYGIDEFVIYQDIRKIKTSMERRKYL
jgi:hypothetical protein